MIVTESEEIATRAKHLSTQAKPNPMEYYHDDIGYNYRLVNVLAAIGVAQMEQLPAILSRKKAIDAYYRKHLGNVGDLSFQEVLPQCDPNCWLFTTTTSRMRELLAHLNAAGVQSRPFWVPMNQLPMFKDAQFVSASDQSAKVFDQAISIPSSAGLTNQQLSSVVAEVRSFFSD